MNPHLAAVITGSVQLVASIFSGLFCDLIGRLPLLLLTSVLMSAALAGFGVYSFYRDAISAALGIGVIDWIPLACVLTFVAAFSLGPNPISWLLVGEVFPLEFRGIGSGLATAFSYVCAFVGVKTFVDLREAVGLHGAFWTYAIVAALGFVFSLIFVPETRGTTLDEMIPKSSILSSSGSVTNAPSSTPSTTSSLSSPENSDIITDSSSNGSGDSRAERV